MLIKIVAVLLGFGLLLLNFVDFGKLTDMLLTRKKKDTPKQDDDEAFLHIIDLWYQLRENCEDSNLSNAVKKLDEVFPLLNDKESQL